MAPTQPRTRRSQRPWGHRWTAAGARARASALVPLVALAGACAAPARQIVQLDPIEIKSRRTEAGPRAYVRDFKVLFEEAMAHYDAGRWAQAIEHFDLIAREFPQHEGGGVVAFNCGLAQLRLGRPLVAAARFRDAIRHGQGSRDARDAVFLLAESLELAGRHAAAARVFAAAAHDPEVARLMGGPLGLLDRLEASARQGFALRAAGDVHGADRALREVERIYEDHRDVRLVEESEWVARSYHERGEIYRELFESIGFKLPVERMARDLEDKANLFLKAQAAYFRAVRLHHVKWSLAAGYRIGGLYTRLIDDIEKAEVPGDLDAETIAVYREELWKHTGKLAQRAATVFRKNIELAQRMGIASDWVEKSRRELTRVEERQAQEERAARRREREEKHPQPKGK